MFGDQSTTRLAHDVLIVSTELATNAVVHARSPFELSIRRTTAGCSVEVRDTSSAAPVARRTPTGGKDRGGRGIAIVAGVSDAWGVRDEDDGKTVWARLR